VLHSYKPDHKQEKTTVKLGVVEGPLNLMFTNIRIQRDPGAFIRVMD
jgi:hypothetical protein